MTTVIEIATSHGRDYITPEDVSEALTKGGSPDCVRKQVLEVLGKQTAFDAEDYGLCAYIAARGTPE